MSTPLLDLEPIALSDSLTADRFDEARRLVADQQYLPSEKEFVTRLFYLSTVDSQSTKNPFSAKHLEGFGRSFGCWENSQFCQSLARHVRWIIPGSMLTLALSSYIFYRTIDSHPLLSKGPLLSLIGAGVSIVTLVSSIIVACGTEHPRNETHERQERSIKKCYRLLTQHLVRLKGENRNLALYLSQNIQAPSIKSRFIDCGLSQESAALIATDLQAANEYVLKDTMNDAMSRSLKDFIVERNQAGTV